MPDTQRPPHVSLAPSDLDRVVAVCWGLILITISWGNDIVPAVPQGSANTMAPGHCYYGASHANGRTSPTWSRCNSRWLALAPRHQSGGRGGTADIYSCCIIRSMLHSDMDLHNFWCIHKFRRMFCVLLHVACYVFVRFALAGMNRNFMVNSVLFSIF